MNKHFFRIFSIVMLVVLLISACAQAQPTQPAEQAATQPPEQAAAKKLKVALILPGRKDDVSWNQAAFDGMNKAVAAAKVPVDLTIVEQVYDPVDIEPALRDYAKQGYDLVVGHGFQFQEPIIKVATEFPNVNFAIGTGYKLAPNVGVYDTKLEQGGYLMGLIAGALTKKNLVGAVGGVDVSEIHRGHVAYLQGAQKINPAVKVLNTFVGDFNDLAGAKEAALSQMNAGADLLWQSGDGVGIAVLGACKEKNTNCMGNVVDQTQLAPDNVIASFVYNWAPVYTQMINETADKAFGNKKYWIELANDGVSVVYNEKLKNLITPDLQKALDAAIAGFKANTLDLGDLDNVKLETTQ